MRKPLQVTDVYLQPGELWFGDASTRIRTILGSCVAITLWHPRLRIGGMCHYMLPSRRRLMGKEADGRYANEALALLLEEIRRAGCRPQEFEAKLFGGGRMFHPPSHPGRPYPSIQVNEQNVAAAHALVATHGFHVKAEHLGGYGHRHVVFELWSGHAWMKHTPLPMAGCHRPSEVNA